MIKCVVDSFSAYSGAPEQVSCGTALGSWVGKVERPG